MSQMWWAKEFCYESFEISFTYMLFYMFEDLILAPEEFSELEWGIADNKQAVMEQLWAIKVGLAEKP